MVTPLTLLAQTRTKLALCGLTSRVNSGRIHVGVFVPEKKPAKKWLKKLNIKPEKNNSKLTKNDKLTHCHEPGTGQLGEESGKN